MDGDLTERVMTRESCADIDARKFESMHAELRHVFVGESQPDRYAVETASRADRPTYIVDVFFCE